MCSCIVCDIITLKNFVKIAHYDLSRIRALINPKVKVCMLLIICLFLFHLKESAAVSCLVEDPDIRKDKLLAVRALG